MAKKFYTHEGLVIPPMKVYRQTSRPILDEDDKMCIWIDTDDGDKPYLVLRVSASVYKMMDFYISG